MAIMLPSDLETFTTEGERRFYRFMAMAAKPDARYLCWYTPDIHGREPDFVIFSAQFGLVVVEVKDWELDQIVEANPQHFRLSMGQTVEQRQNPHRQAREYLYQLVDVLKNDGRLLSDDPAHHGNPKIPINCAVCFANINKHEYTKIGFDKVIAVDKIIFWDDMHPESDICRDQSGRCFLELIERKCSTRFRFSLNNWEHDHLKQLLFPSVRITLPQRASVFPHEKRLCRLRSLDHRQELLARKYDGGHRILVGPSGSGKTLILVHKAAFLLRYDPQIKRILFLCFNISLVNYIRRLLGDRGVPIGDEGVVVKHFFQLCADILDQNVEYENEVGEYYDLIIEESLSKVTECRQTFDAILVDEGQDFSDDMLKLVTGLLNPNTNNLTIVLDDNQNIYSRRSAWKAAGIQARGRVHRISHVYRSTRQLSQLAANFAGTASGKDTKPSEQMPLFPDFFDFDGPEAEVMQFAGWPEITTWVATTIRGMIDSNDCPPSDIAVLYTTREPGDWTGPPLPALLQSTFESKGILSRWASDSVSSKQNYDITTNSVTISTIHSAKGLDFACVFLLGLDHLSPERWSAEQIEKLVYVGITRARYQLFVPYSEKNELIIRLDSCR